MGPPDPIDALTLLGVSSLTSTPLFVKYSRASSAVVQQIGQVNTTSSPVRSAHLQVLRFGLSTCQLLPFRERTLTLRILRHILLWTFRHITSLTQLHQRPSAEPIIDTVRRTSVRQHKQEIFTVSDLPLSSRVERNPCDRPTNIR